MNILETIVSHDTVVPIKKLADVTVEEDCSIYHLDLTGHTWAEHMFVLIHYTPGEDTTTHDMPVFANTASGTYYTPSGTSLRTEDKLLVARYSAPFSSLLYTGRSGNCPMSGISFTDCRVFASIPPMSTRSFTGLTLGNTQYSWNPLKAGSKIEIWGIL